MIDTLPFYAGTREVCRILRHSTVISCSCWLLEAVPWRIAVAYLIIWSYASGNERYRVGHPRSSGSRAEAAAATREM